MIKIQNLTKKFGTLTALDGVSFEVREVAIFGYLTKERIILTSKGQ